MTIGSRDSVQEGATIVSIFGRTLVLSGVLCTVLLVAQWTLRAQAQSNPATSDGPAETPIAAPMAAQPKASGRKGIPTDPIGVIQALYPFEYPLGLTSVVVLWVAIERIVVLRRGRVIPQAFVKRFFEMLDGGSLDPKSALRLCEENGSPVAQIFAHGIRKWGKTSVEVEQAIIDGGERQVSQLRTHLRILNGCATVAPLLGLLGTVVGMIQSFNEIAMSKSSNKTEELAAGIGLALLTTAVGLMIAIPALILYMYLVGRVDALVMEMDRQSQRLVDLISAEGLQEQARSGTRVGRPPEPKKAV